MTAPIPREALEDGERILWTGGRVAPLSSEEPVDVAISVVFGVLFGALGVKVISDIPGLPWAAPEDFSWAEIIGYVLGVVLGVGPVLVLVLFGLWTAVNFRACMRALSSRQRQTTFAVTDRAALVVVGGPNGQTRYPIDAGTRIDLGLGSRPFVHMATVTTVEEGSPVHKRAGFEGMADPMGAYAQLLAVREAQHGGHDAQQGPCTVAGGRLPGQ